MIQNKRNQQSIFKKQTISSSKQRRKLSRHSFSIARCNSMKLSQTRSRILNPSLSSIVQKSYEKIQSLVRNKKLRAFQIENIIVATLTKNILADHGKILKVVQIDQMLLKLIELFDQNQAIQLSQITKTKFKSIVATINDTYGIINACSNLRRRPSNRKQTKVTTASFKQAQQQNPAKINLRKTRISKTMKLACIPRADQKKRRNTMLIKREQQCAEPDSKVLINEFSI